MEKNNRPKVELALNVSTKLKMLRDKCFEGKSNNGAYYLYTVEHEGIEKVYFADPDVHSKIVEAGLKTGDEFLVTKTVGTNGKRISAEYIFESLNSHSVRDVSSTVDDFKTIMVQSLRDAIEIARLADDVNFTSEDIRSICSCLYISRTRNN